MESLLAIPSIISLGSINIALLDVVALVLMIFALIKGYVMGFAKQILSILGIFTAIILAFVFADDVSNFITKSLPFITEKIEQGVVKAIGISADNLNSEKALREALQNTSVPSFLHGAIIKVIVESNFEIKLTTTLTVWAQNIICFVIIFVFALIGFALIKRMANKLTSLPVVKNVDKILGMLFNVLKTLLMVILTLTFASTVFSLNQYLEPEGTTCVLNSAINLITNSSWFEKLLSKIII